MKAVNTLRLAKEKVFFGPGPTMLFEQIEATSSLRKATQLCGLSYSKALRMLREMEKELGFPVVITERGGSQRGATRLTDPAKKILQSYKKVEREVGDLAQQLVRQEFAWLDGEGTGL